MEIGSDIGNTAKKGVKIDRAPKWGNRSARSKAKAYAFLPGRTVATGDTGKRQGGLPRSTSFDPLFR